MSALTAARIAAVSALSGAASGPGPGPLAEHSSLPALPDATTATVAAMHDGCRRLEQWMDETEDLAALDEAQHWLSAVEEYLSHKNAERPAQITARLLEARIGDVLGPEREKGGRGKPSLASEGLQANERYQFRLLAEHRDVWAPRLPLMTVCSRARVLRLIRDDLADLRPIPETPETLMCDLRLGDFRTVLADVPDGSVDLILTDPQYPAEFLPLWTDLGIFARRVLAPSGMLAVVSGQVHLPEVYQRLGEHLTYRWTMAYLMGGAAAVVQAHNVSTMWKPVLIYGSSDRRLHDVATSRAADKDYHGWGRSESGMYDLLRLLADPGALVCDPFAGGGTTAVVAQAHGCHFIGAEIDAEIHRIAAARIAVAGAWPATDGAR
jgi:site-specific DNA-methyltransferase (adenine-specific)